MASYTQPTGFLAATFPSTVSSYAGGAVASVTAGVTVTTNNDKTGYTVSTVSDKTGYSLTAGTGLGNQTANITGNLSGSVGSVTTVSTGAITTASFAAGAIDAAAIATDAIGSAEISAAAVTKIQTGLATPTNITAATGVTLAAVTHTGAVIPTVSTVTNGVTLATTQPAITFGAVTIDVSGSTPNITLTGSGSGNGIEWTRSGSGNPLDADVVDQIQSGLSTEVAAIKTKTDQLTFTVANKVDSAAELDSAVAAQITAIETFATRVTTGIVQDGAVWQFTANMLELGPSGGGGGGDATLAKQTEILAAIQGSEVIQVASPNVSGNLVLTQGDDYDGVANPRAQWTVTTDYTTGWTVRLTIRDADDAVVYTNTGSVVSATVVAVTIAAPTGLTMTGCPGQWQGKFDVELTHSSGKKKTIALGVCYINEDQTR
jgi:hypothetical protein